MSRRERGEILLPEAADLDTVLIVAGAYGHTGVTERALGSVTQTLLRAMTVPVLMSHWRSA
ncbi:universal stress protein, partial [Paraburkholderia piptadeniae]|uniref:universal stress protein n=1 Tax=Paraburkholderia piptadeniae TaxID=1701573 RepID=UPI001F160D10